MGAAISIIAWPALTVGAAIRRDVAEAARQNPGVAEPSDADHRLNLYPAAVTLAAVAGPTTYVLGRRPDRRKRRRLP